MPNDVTVIPTGQYLPPAQLRYPHNLAEDLINRAAEVMGTIIDQIEEDGVTETTVVCKKCQKVLRVPPTVLAQVQAMKNLGGMVDQLTRLHSFTQGGPDSRVELGFNDEMLRYLTPEQLETFQGWIAEGKHRMGG